VNIVSVQKLESVCKFPDPIYCCRDPSRQEGPEQQTVPVPDLRRMGKVMSWNSSCSLCGCLAGQVGD